MKCKMNVGRMPRDWSLSASLQSWLGQELESRGIDALIYTRYILSLLQQDHTDAHLTDAHFFPPDKRAGVLVSPRGGQGSHGQGSHGTLLTQAKGWKPLGGKKRPVPQPAVSVDGDEELKKSAAIECLLSVSDDDSGIEGLVDELYLKLQEQLTKRKGATHDDNLRKLTDVGNEIGIISASPVDPAERYYAAFPALSDRCGELTPKAVAHDKAPWAATVAKRSPNSQPQERSWAEEITEQARVVREREKAKSEDRQLAHVSRHASRHVTRPMARGGSGAARKELSGSVNQGLVCGGGRKHKQSSKGDESWKKEGKRAGVIKGRSLFREGPPSQLLQEPFYNKLSASENRRNPQATPVASIKTTARIGRTKSWPDVEMVDTQPSFIVPKVAGKVPLFRLHQSFLDHKAKSRCEDGVRAADRGGSGCEDGVRAADRGGSGCEDGVRAADRGGSGSERSTRKSGSPVDLPCEDDDLFNMSEDLSWYTEPLNALVPASPTPRERLYRRSLALERHLYKEGGPQLSHFSDEESRILLQCLLEAHPLEVLSPQNSLLVTLEHSRLREVWARGALEDTADCGRQDHAAEPAGLRADFAHHWGDQLISQCHLLDATVNAPSSRDENENVKTSNCNNKLQRDDVDPTTCFSRRPDGSPGPVGLWRDEDLASSVLTDLSLSPLRDMLQSTLYEVTVSAASKISHLAEQISGAQRVGGAHTEDFDQLSETRTVGGTPPGYLGKLSGAQRVCGTPFNESKCAFDIYSEDEGIETKEDIMEVVSGVEAGSDSTAEEKRRLGVFESLMEASTGQSRSAQQTLDGRQESAVCLCTGAEAESPGQGGLASTETSWLAAARQPPSAYKGIIQPEITQNKVPDDRPDVGGGLQPLDCNTIDNVTHLNRNNHIADEQTNLVHICGCNFSNYLFDSSVWCDHDVYNSDMVTRPSPRGWALYADGPLGMERNELLACSSAVRCGLGPASPSTRRPASTLLYGQAADLTFLSRVTDLWDLCAGQLWEDGYKSGLEGAAWNGVRRDDWSPLAVDRTPWEDTQRSPPSKIWDVNVHIKGEMESPNRERSGTLDNIHKYLLNIRLDGGEQAEVRAHAAFIPGGLYGGALGTADPGGDAWSRARSECSEDEGIDPDEGMWIDFSLTPLSLSHKSSSLEQLSVLIDQAAEFDDLPSSPLGGAVDDRSGGVAVGVEIRASETSAFSKDAIPSRLTHLLHIHSEPSLSPLQASAAHKSSCHRSVQVKHLYKPDTSILRQLGLASGPDLEEGGGTHIEYSPDCHFKPICTPQNSPASDRSDTSERCQGADCSCGGDHVQDENVATVTGSSCDTVRTLEDVSYLLSPASQRLGYQLYQGQETVDVSFIPKFKVHQDYEKYIQTSTMTSPENDDGTKVLSERLRMDMRRMLSMEEEDRLLSLTETDLDLNLLGLEATEWDTEAQPPVSDVLGRLWQASMLEDNAQDPACCSGTQSPASSVYGLAHLWQTESMLDNISADPLSRAWESVSGETSTRQSYQSSPTQDTVGLATDPLARVWETVSGETSTRQSYQSSPTQGTVGLATDPLARVWETVSGETSTRQSYQSSPTQGTVGLATDPLARVWETVSGETSTRQSYQSSPTQGTVGLATDPLARVWETVSGETSTRQSYQSSPTQDTVGLATDPLARVWETVSGETSTRQSYQSSPTQDTVGLVTDPLARVWESVSGETSTRQSYQSSPTQDMVGLATTHELPMTAVDDPWTLRADPAYRERDDLPREACREGFPPHTESESPGLEESLTRLWIVDTDGPDGDEDGAFPASPPRELSDGLARLWLSGQAHQGNAHPASYVAESLGGEWPCQEVAVGALGGALWHKADPGVDGCDPRTAGQWSLAQLWDDQLPMATGSGVETAAKESPDVSRDSLSAAVDSVPCGSRGGVGLSSGTCVSIWSCGDDCGLPVILPPVVPGTAPGRRLPPDRLLEGFEDSAVGRSEGEAAAARVETLPSPECATDVVGRKSPRSPWQPSEQDSRRLSERPEWSPEVAHRIESPESAGMIFQFDKPEVRQDCAVFSSDLEEQWLQSEDHFSVQVPRKGSKSAGPHKKPCSFFLEGQCRRTDCRFAHDMASITCRFWEAGDCFKGITCPFLHGYASESKDERKKPLNAEDDDFPALSSAVWRQEDDGSGSGSDTPSGAGSESDGAGSGPDGGGVGSSGDDLAARPAGRPPGPPARSVKPRRGLRGETERCKTTYITYHRQQGKDKTKACSLPIDIKPRAK